MANIKPRVFSYQSNKFWTNAWSFFFINFVFISLFMNCTEIKLRWASKQERMKKKNIICTVCDTLDQRVSLIDLKTAHWTFASSFFFLHLYLIQTKTSTRFALLFVDFFFKFDHYHLELDRLRNFMPYEKKNWNFSEKIHESNLSDSKFSCCRPNTLKMKT